MSSEGKFERNFPAPPPPPTPKPHIPAPPKPLSAEQMKLPTFDEVVAQFDATKKEPSSIQEVERGLGIHFKNITLFHGSTVTNIQRLDKAIENTVGDGIYMTPDARSAAGYAQVRSRGHKPKVLYKAEAQDITLMDLRKEENVQTIANEFKALLKKRIKTETRYNMQGAMKNAIEEITNKNIRAGTIKNMAHSFGEIFSELVKQRNFDGLITIEGGEGSIGDHDSYVIFDPEKIRVEEEVEFR